MWFIIPVLSTFVLVMLIGFLIHCDWSPIVRCRYRDMGWTDGERASHELPPLPRHLEWALQNEYSATGRMVSYGADTRTDLTMSARRFTYYIGGYQDALEYARWKEGIIATRRSELDRVRRLDHEIRQAHHELKEEA